MGFICTVSIPGEYNKTYCREESQVEHAELYRLTFNSRRKAEVDFFLLIGCRAEVWNRSAVHSLTHMPLNDLDAHFDFSSFLQLFYYFWPFMSVMSLKHVHHHEQHQQIMHRPKYAKTKLSPRSEPSASPTATKGCSVPLCPPNPEFPHVSGK